MRDRAAGWFRDGDTYPVSVTQSSAGLRAQLHAAESAAEFLKHEVKRWRERALTAESKSTARKGTIGELLGLLDWSERERDSWRILATLTNARLDNARDDAKALAIERARERLSRSPASYRIWDSEGWSAFDTDAWKRDRVLCGLKP